MSKREVLSVVYLIFSLTGIIVWIIARCFMGGVFDDKIQLFDRRPCGALMIVVIQVGELS